MPEVPTQRPELLEVLKDKTSAWTLRYPSNLLKIM